MLDLNIENVFSLKWSFVPENVEFLAYIFDDILGYSGINLTSCMDNPRGLVVVVRHIHIYFMPFTKLLGNSIDFVAEERKSEVYPQSQLIEIKIVSLIKHRLSHLRCKM